MSFGEAPVHLPVMEREVVRILSSDEVELFLDATVGAGGHARALLEKAGPRAISSIFRELLRASDDTALAGRGGAVPTPVVEAELWAATLGRSADVDDLWKRTLTQQFHDILPGSSIAWVHADAEAVFAEVGTELDARIASLLAAVTGPGAWLSWQTIMSG